MFFQDPNPDRGIGFALPPDFDPKGLLLPHLQAQFARVLAVGGSDLAMEQINWDEVIRKWSVNGGEAAAQPSTPAKRGSGTSK